MQASWNLWSFTQVPFDIPLKNACHFITFFREKIMLFTLFALMYTFIKYWQEKKMLILEEKNVFIYDLGGTDTYKL